MTCIIFNKCDVGVLGGTDSALTIGTHIISVNDKLFVQNGVLIGFAGSRVGMQYFKTIINIDPKMETDDKYLDSVHKIISDSEKIFQNTTIMFSAGIQISFLSLGGWFRCADDYYAIGDGYEIALGSMFSSSIQDPQTKITLALEAATYYKSSVRKPFIFKQI